MPDQITVALLESEHEARDLAAEADALSDLGRRYLVSWLVYATDPAERQVVARAISRAREYEAELDQIRAQVAGS